jgi:hypothetical protein
VERADDRVLSALSSLQSSPDWATVVEWIAKSRAANVNTLLITKEEVQTRWLQGSIQALDAILDVSNRATGILHHKRSTE